MSIFNYSMTVLRYLTTGFDKTRLTKLVEFLYLWLNKEEHMDRKLKRKVLELARLYKTTDDSCNIAKEAKRFRLLGLASISYSKLRDDGSPMPSPREDAPFIGATLISSASISSCSISSISSFTSSTPSSLSSCSFSGHSPRPRSFSFSKLPDPYKVDILKHSSSSIAKQLTLIDHELISSLSMVDLKNKILKPADRHDSVADISARFNHMSFWVATQIVVAPSPKLRVEIVEKFISISAKLLKYNNFLGVFQILSGLHNSNIRRLKSCWKNVSQKSNSQLLKIEQVMSHTGNYSHYRALTRECVQKGLPCVPLLCLLLQDLTFINDGNDNETTDGRVNFDKWNMFGSCMLGFSKLMEKKYNFHKHSTIKRMLMNDLLVLPETLIMKHSYAIETRKRMPCHGTSF